ncbi:hypothetical protein C8J57DRAFT_1212774 [Mycena rebaudengoi]|nr:hypothetical protein C8J57DRAFT_1212774 [Mycena rebaudengoi]
MVFRHGINSKGLKMKDSELAGRKFENERSSGLLDLVRERISSVRKDGRLSNIQRATYGMQLLDMRGPMSYADPWNHSIDMFLRLAFVVASVSIAASAAVTPTRRQGPPITPPDTILCCSSVQRCTDAGPTAVGGGINCGLSCSPLTVIGNNCGSTTTQCDAPEKEWAVFCGQRKHHARLVDIACCIRQWDCWHSVNTAICSSAETSLAY